MKRDAEKSRFFVKTAGATDIPATGANSLPDGIDFTRRDGLFRLENGDYDHPLSDPVSQARKIASSAPIVKPSGWDDRTALQQQKAIRNSGLSKEDQMTLLNAGTSVETIALIQDIQRNRELYGLSQSDADAASKTLLSIANARIGAKTHAMPFFISDQETKVFMDILDEQESSLLASINYGIAADFEANVPGQKNRPQIPALLGEDSTGVPLLYEGGNLSDISASFFESAAKYEEIQKNVEKGTIVFLNDSQKQRYLEYLEEQSAKNEAIYRRQLAEYINSERLPTFRKDQLTSLTNDLTVDQLKLLTDEIDEKGIRYIDKDKNWESLMRTLLSDPATASHLCADEKYSPICPRVWEGVDIEIAESIHISGYYYKNGQYFVDIQRYNYLPATISLGQKVPSDVSVRITRATSWEMFGEQLELFVKMCTTPSALADIGYTAAVGSGVPAFLPPGLLPSDIPQLAELLNEIDLQDHTPHITKETVYITLFIEHGSNGESGYSNEEATVHYDELRKLDRK